ncbi:hypothetical protein COV19_00310 [Candidatus Woesearchaeota archaeon CG10_big_fil_rev_8_21_14_0_10_44_13]|nr:MAG: hypothetical protein COV19_00310 [Candidatus Woesearchaeota archaeon CG10_big_fil_rev_8_21_14_0_10_44_13]
MKKYIVLPFLFALASTLVSADWGGMMGDYGSGGYGMMGWGVGVMGLFGLLYLALAAFIVSGIFWLTYKWIVKDKGRKR